MSGLDRRVRMIVARDRAGAIGRANQLPWRLPEDLKQFKALTLGCAVIMGRKTWDSLPGVLPDRFHVVMSRRAPTSRPNPAIAWVGDLPEAVRVARAHCPGRPWIIGGGEIYRLALPFADELHLTEVDTEIEGADAWFPPFAAADARASEPGWQRVRQISFAPDARHAHAFSFNHWQRVPEDTSP